MEMSHEIVYTKHDDLTEVRCNEVLVSKVGDFLCFKTYTVNGVLD